MKKLLFLLLLMPFSAQAFDVVVTVSWNSNPYSDLVTVYQCEKKVNDSPYASCSADIVAPSNSITETVANVTPGDTLTFRVRACNTVGCSNFTAGVSATVPANLIPSVPMSIQILPMVITQGVQ